MSIILFIVAASLFQTVLEITHPVLLALSASSRNISSHFKVLVLCLLLCLVPAYMSHLLISTVGKIRIFLLKQKKEHTKYLLAVLGIFPIISLKIQP